MTPRLLIAACAVALLAAQAPRSGKPFPVVAPIDDPPSKPTSKPESPWRMTLTGGMTAELLGIGLNSWEGNQWWNPDGLPLAKVPSGFTSYIPTPPDVFRDVAIRVTNAPEGAQYIWKATPSGYPAFSLDEPSDADELGKIRRASVHFPPNVAKFSLRFGIASGPWKTVLAANIHGQAIAGTTNGDEVMVARPREVNKRTSIVVCDTIKALDEFRVIVFDRTGKLHKTFQMNSGSNIFLRMHDVEFDLPLDQIEKFEFQSRPFEWAEFVDVPVNPRPAEPKATPAPKER